MDAQRGAPMGAIRTRMHAASTDGSVVPAICTGSSSRRCAASPIAGAVTARSSKFRSKLERGVMAGNICTHNDAAQRRHRRRLLGFRQRGLGPGDAISPRRRSRRSPAGSRTRWICGRAMRSNKPRLARHAVPALHRRSQGGGDGVLARRLQGRVCRNVYPLASLLARGYIPVRFRALANDTSEPQVATAQAPDAGTKAPGPKAQAARQHRRHARRQ